MNTRQLLICGACAMLFCLLASFAESFILLGTAPNTATSASIDNFGNTYTFSNNKLYKYSPEGKLLYPYEEFRYGNIGAIDVSNSLKPIVFFPDFQKAVILDKFLSPLTIYDFLQLGYANVPAVCGSTDNRIWFYDSESFKLKKIDETGSVLRESQPLTALLERTPVPNFMLERDNFVYMNDSTQGILVFDIFGSYQKTIPLKGLRKFQVLQDNIVFYDSAALFSYQTKTLSVTRLALPDTANILQAVIAKERLTVLKKDVVVFYRY